MINDLTKHCARGSKIRVKLKNLGSIYLKKKKN